MAVRRVHSHWMRRRHTCSRAIFLSHHIHWVSFTRTNTLLLRTQILDVKVCVCVRRCTCSHKFSKFDSVWRSACWVCVMEIKSCTILKFLPKWSRSLVFYLVATETILISLSWYDTLLLVLLIPFLLLSPAYNIRQLPGQPILFRQVNWVNRASLVWHRARSRWCVLCGCIFRLQTLKTRTGILPATQLQSAVCTAQSLKV